MNCFADCSDVVAIFFYFFILIIYPHTSLLTLSSIWLSHLFLFCILPAQFVASPKKLQRIFNSNKKTNLYFMFQIVFKFFLLKKLTRFMETHDPHMYKHNFLIDHWKSFNTAKVTLRIPWIKLLVDYIYI
jgi:hypothetical protein